MTEPHDNPRWHTIYYLGALAATGSVLAAVLEMAITFLPGGDVTPATIGEWFSLLQDNWFLGLRNLGLLNIVINLLGMVTFFALYIAHRRTADRPLAGLAAIVAFVGSSVFFATNRALPMLALSHEYMAATTDAQQAALEAAGQALLAVGASHTQGTFLAFFLLETAGLLMSIVMLRNAVFSRAAGYAGIAGFGLLLIFEFATSFFTGLNWTMLVLSMAGGLASLIWYVLIGWRFWRLAQSRTEEI